MMDSEKIEKMEDGKDKELLKLLNDGGKPYMRKSDGTAKQVTEDKEITYKDYNDQELTLKVPKGSYLVLEEGHSCPKIVTAEEFEQNNKFIEGEKAPEKKESKEKLGLELVSE